MHPVYGELRQALAEPSSIARRSEARAARAQPQARADASGGQAALHPRQRRAAAALSCTKTARPVDSMVVVVGKTKCPTPMLAAYIRYAALNPYWYVPPDLAGERRRPVRREAGTRLSRRHGVPGGVRLERRTPRSSIPRRSIGRRCVDGKVEVMIRQLPGPHNFMGRMKFMFPNEFGVYLHDNPERELFKKAARYFSGGCVRLEDARAARPLAVRPRSRLGRRRHRGAGAAGPAGAGLHHLLTAMPDGRRSPISTTSTGATRPGSHIRAEQRKRIGGGRQPLEPPASRRIGADRERGVPDRPAPVESAAAPRSAGTIRHRCKGRRSSARSGSCSAVRSIERAATPSPLRRARDRRR